MNQPQPIEALITGLDIEGTFNNIDFFEQQPSDVSHIISVGESWGVNLEWEMNKTGANSPVLLPPNVYTWQVLLFLEGLGGAGEFTFGPFAVPYATGVPGPAVALVSDTRTFKTSLPFAAFTVDPGLYKTGVTIQLEDAGGTPQAVAGYIEGALLNFRS